MLRPSAIVVRIAAALLLAAACAPNARTLVTLSSVGVPLGLDPVIPTPIENEPSTLKVQLGERLFFDPILSVDGTRSCSSCHRPEFGFADDRARSLGVGDQPTRRNTPTLLNRAWGRFHFRDGRAPSLEAAVLQPILNPGELGLTLPILEERLAGSRSYRRLFEDAFGRGARPTAERAAQALATFIRSLRSGDSRADRYRRGDPEVLTPLELEGQDLFFGSANCARCHSGPNFTDESFHNTGVAVRSGDPGRYAVTGEDRHLGAFLTPTLRDLARTAPYMHDGSFASLEEVIDFYDEGGGNNPNLDFQIRSLRLTLEQKEALLAFLGTLTAPPAGEG